MEHFEIEHGGGGGYWYTMHPLSIDRNNDPWFSVSLLDEYDVLIGDVFVLKTKYKNLWETHAEIGSIYRGRGYGVALYSAAIDEAHRLGYNIGSSLTYSPDAERLWRSKRLNNKYKIHRLRKRFIVLRTMPVCLSGRQDRTCNAAAKARVCSNHTTGSK